MSCRALITTSGFSSCASVSDFKKSPKLHAKSCPTLRTLCSSSSPDLHITTGILEKSGSDALLSGGAYDFEGATTSLTQKSLSSPKKVTLLRHGLSTWNEEDTVKSKRSAKKILQWLEISEIEISIMIHIVYVGSSNLSVLTETGVKQAEKCRKALSDLYFDCCFSSPISRAKSTAEVIWQDRTQPLFFLDSLKEAHLYFLEGMKNVYGGSGCYAGVSKRVFNMERGSCKFLRKWCISSSETMGNSA